MRASRAPRHVLPRHWTTRYRETSFSAWRITTRWASGSTRSSPSRSSRSWRCSTRCPRVPTSAFSTIPRTPSSADSIRSPSSTRIKHRVVTVHASDRFVAPGATLDELRSHDGTIGYPDRLIHGETGRGANDYDAIFRLLRSVRVCRLDLGRGRHERPRRAAAVGPVPEGEAGAVLRRRRRVIRRRAGLQLKRSRLPAIPRASRAAPSHHLR